MRNTLEIFTNNRRAAKKLVTAVLFLCLLAVSIFSEAFVAAGADHVHDNEGVDGGCAACAQVQCLENTIKLPGVISGGGATAFADIFAAAAIPKPVCLPVSFFSLTDSKIRMNN